MTDEKKKEKAGIPFAKVQAVIALVGILLVSAGAFWIYKPAGPIVAGLMLFFESSKK